MVSTSIQNFAIEESDINNISSINSKDSSKTENLHLKQKRFLVLVYNSFADPLFQNLILAYIKTQCERHPHYSVYL